MAISEQGLVLSFIATLVGILLFLSEIPGNRKIAEIISLLDLNPDTWPIYIKRIKGFIGLGIIPMILMTALNQSNNFYGLLHLGYLKLWLFVVALSILILVINYFNSQTQSNLDRYPEIRIDRWTVYTIVGSSSTWILYLLGYEFLFRGILLFSCIEFMNPITAITLNIMIYSLFHLQKGQKETFASIPFGIVLCLLTLKSQSIWPAVFLHSVLALSNEWFSIYFSFDKIFTKIHT